jgi:hypothetical protein
MSVGVSAERLSPAINGVCLPPKMAQKRDMVANESSFARKTSQEIRESETINGSDRRQSIGQNDRKKREVFGFDGTQKVKGGKRQLIVDSLGLVLKVVVYEGNAGERVLTATALMELIEENRVLVEKIALLRVDSGYSGVNEGGRQEAEGRRVFL